MKKLAVVFVLVFCLIMPMSMGTSKAFMEPREYPAFCGAGVSCGWCGVSCALWMMAMIGDGGLDV